jgi:hypothetical protein
MKARSRDLLDRAVAAMAAAIDVCNKPDFAYRGEAFWRVVWGKLFLRQGWLCGEVAVMVAVVNRAG